LGEDNYFSISFYLFQYGVEIGQAADAFVAAGKFALFGLDELVAVFFRGASHFQPLPGEATYYRSSPGK